MEELWDGVSHYSEEKGWPMLGRMKIDILNSLIVATAILSSAFQEATLSSVQDSVICSVWTVTEMKDTG